MKTVSREFFEWISHPIGVQLDTRESGPHHRRLSRQAFLGANRFFPGMIVLAMALGSVPAYAGTQAEYRALQQWCAERDKMAKEGRKADYPNPPEYFHFHHYCIALKEMNSLYSAVGKAKINYTAGSVMRETNYVIAHVPESHTLMPEVYALRGKAMALVKQNTHAEANLLKALQLDPKHVGAYVTLANYYFDTKRRAKAEETVETGLSVDSQNKALRRLASELGIKLEAMKPGGMAVEPVATPTPEKEVVVMEPAPDRPKAEPAPANQTSTEPSRIGSPTNPWCRFCPDPVVKP